MSARSLMLACLSAPEINYTFPSACPSARHVNFEHDMRRARRPRKRNSLIWLRMLRLQLVILCVFVVKLLSHWPAALVCAEGQRLALHWLQVSNKQPSALCCKCWVLSNDRNSLASEMQIKVNSLYDFCRTDWELLSLRLTPFESPSVFAACKRFPPCRSPAPPRLSFTL